MEENKTPNSKIFHLFVRLLEGKTLTLKFRSPSIQGDALKHQLYQITKIPPHQQLLRTGTHQISDDFTISCAGDSTSIFPTVHLLLRLVGGKGGFGSLLRGAATKAGQKKTNNFDACRDMSGRRLRHVNAEKKLEEWKAEEEERRLEKVAEEFLKKKYKVGKKGVGDGEAKKYVEKYREESARCVAEVEESVRQAVMNGKRKGGLVGKGVDAKKLKIWMGKRKLGENDSDDTDEDNSDDEEEAKSVILNNGNISDSSKESDGISVSGAIFKPREVSGGQSGSEEEKELVVQGSTESSGCPGGESLHAELSDAVEPMIHDGMNSQSTVVPCSEAEVVSVPPVVQDGNKDCDGTEFGNESDAVSLPHDIPSSSNGKIVETIFSDIEVNGSSESKLSIHEEPVTTTSNLEMQKPLNFDDFSSAAEMEVLGLERLKSELQEHRLKCGGTLQERAARLFLLKTTPLDKLPKKLLAKK